MAVTLSRPDLYLPLPSQQATGRTPSGGVTVHPRSRPTLDGTLNVLGNFIQFSSRVLANVAFLDKILQKQIDVLFQRKNVNYNLFDECKKSTH